MTTGVGGWADSGVDPREYAVKLSEGCRKEADGAKTRDPVKIMQAGWETAKDTIGSRYGCNNTRMTALLKVREFNRRIV